MPGNRLVSSHATNNGKRYRYYITSMARAGLSEFRYSQVRVLPRN
jgi:hypothetical protein